MASNKELIIKVGILDDFSKKFEDISKVIKSSSLTNFGSSMKSFGEGMTKKVTLPLLAIAGLSLKASTELDHLTLSIDKFTNSAEETEKVLKEIEGLNLTKVFKINEVREFSSRLLGLGVNLKDLPKTLQVLGQTAVGANIPLEKMYQLYSDVIAKGKLTAEGLALFGKAGVPLRETMAKMFGKSTEDFTNMAIKPETVFKTELLDEALRRMTEKGGRFFGVIEKRSNKAAAVFSQLLNSITRIFENIGKVLEKFIEKYGPTIVETLTKFADAISDFANKHPAITNFTVVLLGMAAAIGPLAFAIGTLVTSLSSLMVLLGAFNIVSITSISIALGGMATSIGMVALAVGKLVAAFGAGYAIGEGMNWLDKKIGQLFGNSEGFMSRGIQSTMSGVSKFFGGQGLMSDREIEDASNQKYNEQLRLKKANIPIPAMEKNKSDINIKISAPEWLQSNITGVKSNGKGANVNFMTESYLGPSFDLPGVR
jgi:CBS domain-containing protein